MPNTIVQVLQDSPEERQAVLAFLRRTGELSVESGGWERRLAHWWDENPHGVLLPYRGLCAWRENRLVGFGGCVPAAYAYQGRQLPVLLATTLRTEPEHTSVGAKICLKMREAAHDLGMIHTTPNPKLQHLLKNMGVEPELYITRRVYATGLLRHFGLGSRWPRPDPKVRIVTSLEGVKSMAAPYRDPARIEKWHTLESLRWHLATRMRHFRCLAAVDAQDRLTSFLVLEERRLRGLMAWDIVESHTCRDTPEELHALAGELITHPGAYGGHRLLTVASFPSDTAWDDTPALFTRQQQACHYFMRPDALKTVPKLTMMAEGDFVL